MNLNKFHDAPKEIDAESETEIVGNDINMENNDNHIAVQFFEIWI